MPHTERVPRDPFHLRVNRLPKVELAAGGLIEVPLELVEGDLVAGFVLAVVLGVLLDGVVGEVHVLATAADAELLRASPDVALAVPPGLSAAPEYPHSNIELSAVVQERHDVPLDYVGAFLPVLVLAITVHVLQ